MSMTTRQEIRNSVRQWVIRLICATCGMNYASCYSGEKEGAIAAIAACLHPHPMFLKASGPLAETCPRCQSVYFARLRGA